MMGQQEMSNNTPLVQNKRASLSIMQSGLLWIWVAVVLIALDLWSKFYVMNHFALYQPVSIMQFFNLMYAQNPGAAFGFLGDHDGWQRWFFTAIAFSISAVLLFFMRKTPKTHRVVNIAYALVIGGALGNLFDRLVHGFVVDFIDFYVGDWHFATFNIADIGICVGAALIVLDGLFTKKQDESNDAA